MLGWLSEEIARASRSKRCFASGLSERCAGKILIATVRSRRVSLAQYTSPMPPLPSGDWISYGPSLVPEVSAIRARHYSPEEAYCSGSERTSTLLTSNRPVEDWGKLLGDSAAVTAMLDRLLHHGHVLKCGPRSWRTKTSAEPAGSNQ